MLILDIYIKLLDCLICALNYSKVTKLGVAFILFQEMSSQYWIQSLIGQTELAESALPEDVHITSLHSFGVMLQRYVIRPYRHVFIIVRPSVRPSSVTLSPIGVTGDAGVTRWQAGIHLYS